MKLTVVGCSPAWPNPGGAQSGYMIESSTGSVLLDCGSGVLSRLRLDRRWPAPDAIVISHFHLDHWGDLVSWVWGALYLRGQGTIMPKPALLVPPGGRAQLERFGTLLGFPDMFDRVFEVAEYPVGEPFAAGGCAITARPVPHYRIDAYALSVKADGKTLAYSADSGPGEALAACAQGADLFVCESTLARGDRDGEPRGHVSIPEALEAFTASGAKELLLTHRPGELERPVELDFATDGLVREI